MPHCCAVPICTSNSKTSLQLSSRKFPSDAALRHNRANNIPRVESKGVWTINSSTRVCTKHFTAESYHVNSVSGRKRMHKTTSTNRIFKSKSKQFSIVFHNNCNPLPARGKHLSMPQLETCERTCGGVLLLDVQPGTCSTVARCGIFAIS